MLPTAFYTRPTLEVAHDLLGKYLVRRINGKTTAYKIVEVEAYDGPLDRACHAAKGKTPRTKVMFGQGGAFYVYFVYGMWEMLNIVTGPKEYPAAVLIRGVESAIGPGRLTKTLGITRALNGKRVAKTSGLWIEDRGEKVSEDDIKTTARIGVSYAGPIWSQKEYRFILKNYFSNKKKRR
jgi:DNA-3-methyladenine glycosylase